MKNLAYLPFFLILTGCAAKEPQITPEPPPISSAPISVATPAPTLAPIIVQSKEAAPAAGIQQSAGAKPMRASVRSTTTTARKRSSEEELQASKAEFAASLNKVCDGIQNASTPAECQQWHDMVMNLQDKADESFSREGMQSTRLRLTLRRVHTNMALAASAKKFSLSVGSRSTVWQRSLQRARQAINELENS